MELATLNGNPLLDHYEQQRAHQLRHGGAFGVGGEPWLRCFECARHPVDPETDDVRLRWSWAIPTRHAIATIVNHSPNGVVEIGAGTGYWARLLGDAGCPVAAYDINPPGGTGPRADGDKAWHARQEAFYPVAYGMSTSVQRHPDRTLLLCWPCYSDPMAYHALRQYEGDTLVYVGEGPGGCTGDDRFHKLLGGDPCWHYDDATGESVDVDPDCEACALTVEWRLVAEVSLPQWAGLHDRLFVYERMARILA